MNPADQPILYLALSSPTLPLSVVDEYAETMMAQRISMVSGVAQVQVYGAQKYAVRAQLDPKALAAKQIGIDGQLTKSLYQYTLQTPDTSELYKYAPLLKSKLHDVPGLQDVTSDLQITKPQVNITIDRDKASVLGVTAQQVEDALFTAYASRWPNATKGRPHSRPSTRAA